MIKNTCVRVSLVLTGRDWWGKAWRRTWREQRWTKIMNHNGWEFTIYRCSSLPSHHCFQAPLFLLFPSSRRTRVVSHQAAWKWNWSENLTICVHPDLIFSAVFSTWSLSKLFTRKQTLVEGWSLNSTFQWLTSTLPHSPRTTSIWRWKKPSNPMLLVNATHAMIKRCHKHVFFSATFQGASSCGQCLQPIRCCTLCLCTHDRPDQIGIVKVSYEDLSNIAKCCFTNSI